MIPHNVRIIVLRMFTELSKHIHARHDVRVYKMNFKEVTLTPLHASWIMLQYVM